MRRTSLQVLKDFGYGKSIMEDIIEEEINNLMEHIDNNFFNQPIDVKRLLEQKDLSLGQKTEPI